MNFEKDAFAKSRIFPINGIILIRNVEVKIIHNTNEFYAIKKLLSGKDHSWTPSSIMNLRQVTYFALRAIFVNTNALLKTRSNSCHSS